MKGLSEFSMYDSRIALVGVLSKIPTSSGCCPSCAYQTASCPGEETTAMPYITVLFLWRRVEKLCHLNQTIHGISFENIISLMFKWTHQRRYVTILLNFTPSSCPLIDSLSNTRHRGISRSLFIHNPGGNKQKNFAACCTHPSLLNYNSTEWSCKKFQTRYM